MTSATSHALRAAAAALAILTSLLLGACGGDASPTSAPAAAQAAVGFPTVPVAEIADRVASDEVLFVEVREDSEWAAGRAPSAIHIPLGSVADRLGEISTQAKGRPVAFICRSGSRSAQASQIAVDGGVRDVINVDGGMLAWEGAGLPVIS